MFGMICQTTLERQTTLWLPVDATVGDVIRELGVRYGESFLNQVMRTSGARASHTQVSVDGCLIRDLSEPVAAGKDLAVVEIILLSGHEGG